MTDPDFHPPGTKTWDDTHSPSTTERQPTSKLAVTSLIFGCLAYPVIPFFGAIVAIVTGHLALGEIKAEEGRLGGRPLAKAGLYLGYIQIALIVIVAAILLAVFTLRESTTRSALGFGTSDGRGVKMANELTTRDVEFLRELKLPESNEEIICVADGGDATDERDLAVLTSKRVISVKGSQLTSMKLIDIAKILDHHEYEARFTPNHFETSSYYIEIKARDAPGSDATTAKPGMRMRLVIRPHRDGPYFHEALQDAWKAVGGAQEIARPNGF